MIKKNTQVICDFYLGHQNCFFTKGRQDFSNSVILYVVLKRQERHFVRILVKGISNTVNLIYM